MFIQPFFIQVTAAHVDSNTTKAVKGGIIGAGALIYLGVGVRHTFAPKSSGIVLMILNLRSRGLFTAQ